MWQPILNPIQRFSLPDATRPMQRRFKPFCWITFLRKAAFPSSKCETHVVKGMPGRDMFDIKLHYRGCQIWNASYISSYSCLKLCNNLHSWTHMWNSQSWNKKKLFHTNRWRSAIYLPHGPAGGVPAGPPELRLTRLKEGKTMKSTRNISI